MRRTGTLASRSLYGQSCFRGFTLVTGDCFDSENTVISASSRASKKASRMQRYNVELYPYVLWPGESSLFPATTIGNTAILASARALRMQPRNAKLDPCALWPGKRVCDERLWFCGCCMHAAVEWSRTAILACTKALARKGEERGWRAESLYCCRARSLGRLFRKPYNFSLCESVRKASRTQPRIRSWICIHYGRARECETSPSRESWCGSTAILASTRALK
jgi:hypothetical protein